MPRKSPADTLRPAAGEPSPGRRLYLRWVLDSVERDIRRETPDMWQEPKLEESSGRKFRAGPVLTVDTSPIPPSSNWADDMLCMQILDPEIFAQEDRASVKFAKRVCAICEVREQCLEDALTSPYRIDGVRGGLTHAERAEFKRQGGVQ